jgi:hypothetical protein
MTMRRAPRLASAAVTASASRSGVVRRTTAR